MARRFVILAAIVLCALPGFALIGSLNFRLDAGLFGLFGGKTQPPPGWILHKQHVELADVHFKSADKACENWSWVAGIVDMAETRGAHIDQQYLIDRLYGGSRCLPSAGDLADMAQRISHDYVLDDFTEDEWPAVSSGIERSVEALVLFARGDLRRAMNEFNRDPESETPETSETT